MNAHLHCVDEVLITPHGAHRADNRHPQRRIPVKHKVRLDADIEVIRRRALQRAFHQAHAERRTRPIRTPARVRGKKVRERARVPRRERDDEPAGHTGAVRARQEQLCARKVVPEEVVVVPARDDPERETRGGVVDDLGRREMQEP